MAGPDTTNPTLTSAVLPNVDVTGGGETVIFSVGALDTGSTVDRVYFYFDQSWEGQSGLDSVIAFSDAADSFSDGISTASVYFDPSSASGTYDISSAIVYDKAGNFTQYSAADLTALGIPTSFNLLSNGAVDTTPPTLTSLSLPNADVTAGAQTVSFSVGALDSGSGVDRVLLYFDHNWDGQSGFSNVVTLSDSVDAFADGSSAAQVYFDPGTPAGTYSITSAIVYDKAGNYTQYTGAQLAALSEPTSFTVASNTPADATPPTLISAILPNVDITSSGQSATFSAQALDVGTGVDHVIFYFDRSWQGQSGLESTVEVSDSKDSFADGLSATLVFFGPTTPAGTYHVTSAIVYDKAGNFTQYSPAQLAALGIATSFNVGRGSLHNDFNGDGHSDILWRNDDGTMSEWLATANGGFDWHVVGTGDFNGDGISDVLWRNDNGTLTEWLGQAGGGWTDNGAHLKGMVAASWQVTGVGDMNGDGKTDILWRNTDGTVSEWLASSSGDGSFVSGAGSSVGPDWHIQGTGDFNGDGIADVLWRNDDGTLTEWLGQSSGGWVDNGANLKGVVATSWTIVGTGDMNGDGLADVLWRNSSDGSVSEWLASSSKSGAFVSGAGASVGADWHIQSIGDFNGDGIDDVFWRNDNGSLVEWLGQPSGGWVSNAANASGTLSTAWHVQDPFF